MDDATDTPEADDVSSDDAPDVARTRTDRVFEVLDWTLEKVLRFGAGWLSHNS